jgi:hypothetical protein
MLIIVKKKKKKYKWLRKVFENKNILPFSVAVPVSILTPKNKKLVV